MATLTYLADDLARHALGFLSHDDGKSSFAQTGRRSRDLQRSTLSSGFAAWSARLSRKQRRWVAKLSVAPRIRAGFESGEDCWRRPQEVLRAVGQSDEAVGRLMAFMAGLIAAEEAGRQTLEEDEEGHALSERGSFMFHFDIVPTDWDPEPFLIGMWELPIVFIALGFVTAPRIEELLSAKLNRERWSTVFDYNVTELYLDGSKTWPSWESLVRGRVVHDSNTILLDPLFSFAKWGRPVVTSRYEMVEAVLQNGMNLEHASAELKSDRELVLEAIKQNGFALYFASETMKADRGVVLEAVKIYGLVLNHASEELRADREVVLTAVRQHGYALQHASAELRRDRGVVLEAVKQNGTSLRHAFVDMQSDRVVVTEAVRQDGRALQYAADELKADRGIVVEAMNMYPHALLHASAALQAELNCGLWL